MLNLSKGTIAILLAAALSWSSTAIAHPPEASAPSHGHHSSSADACAYSCTLLGHGGSTFTQQGNCGTCTCWG